ncbi:MAG: hypothetical protein ABI846_11310 [Rudaea sp.]
MPGIRHLLALGFLIAVACVAHPARADYINNDGIDPLVSARLSELDVEYQKARFDALGASSDPLDWALAALMTTRDEAADRTVRLSELARAAEAAPHDSRTQWIVLIASRSLPNGSAQVAGTVRTLASLDSDNASVWIEALNEAAARHDTAQVDAAMIRMAASRRADDHYADLAKATLDVAKRFPRQTEYVSLWAAQGQSADAGPYLEATAIAAAFGIPAYQTLIRECRVSVSFAAMRRDECASVGRLLVTHGSTLVANRIGSALLRVSRTYDDGDVRRAHEQDWVMQQRSTLFAPDEVDTTEIVASINDLLETGSEIESYRRIVARAGRPAAPADDWQDEQSPFSAERLHADLVAATAGAH